MPSQRIFLLRQRSHAWAMRLCELMPTLMVFKGVMGRMPGILTVVPTVVRRASVSDNAVP